MSLTISGYNVPDAYENALWTMKALKEHKVLKHEETRVGTVLSVPHPVVLEIKNPLQRVLFCEARMANPFFHVVEAVWMLAGGNEAAWLARFNSNMSSFAGANGILHGAYGHRWRVHFGFDQILEVVEHLTCFPESRRAVLTMWDPDFDTDSHNDIPCNTHIYFRILEGTLNMTVCNRSNDLIWGMLGANTVHMTILQELIASALGIPVGTYYAMTNNLHIYDRHWNLLDLPLHRDYYRTHSFEHVPLLRPQEHIGDFLEDCEAFVGEDKYIPWCAWIRDVARPIRDAYLDKENREAHIENIKADDWKLACSRWKKV